MNPRDRILPPYTRRVDDAQHRVTKLIGVSALVLLAMVLGFFIGIFGMYGWYVPAIPVALLAFIALWMAPDVDTRLDGAIERSYFIYWGLALMWPSYIALNVPGLPWVSFQRLAMLVTAVLCLTALSMSPRIRAQMLEVLTSNKVMLRFFLAWVIIHAIMLPVGFMESTGRWVSHSLIWHFLFIISCWIMAKPGNGIRLNRLILIAAAVTAAVTIPEAMQEQPIWVEYIPGFLGIDPELQEQLQFGVVRGTEYRARSIFVVSLVYAEYIGMLLPFVLLAIMSAPSGWRRTAAVALLALVATAAVLTQARSALIALLAAATAFSAIWVLRRYKATKKDQDILSASMLYGFPAAALMLLIAVLTLPPLRVRILGGGQHAASDNAREAQWDMAIPQIITNPVGHGMGSIDRVVPYTNLAGKFTIDSYPINLLIEYGIPGFIAFVGFFATAIYLGMKTFTNAANKEEELAGAAAVGILSFLITRLILSSEGGQNIAFGFAGVILALHFRQQMRIAAGKPAKAEPAAPASFQLRPLPQG
jgi:hypothetical protein